MFRWVNGKNPMQYGFDFGLWTRQIVWDLVEQRFSVRLSLASIGALLARQGLTPQKPLQRAYSATRKPSKNGSAKRIQRLRAKPKRDKADIYFWGRIPEVPRVLTPRAG